MKRWYLFLAASVIATLIAAPFASATPYWTPQDMQRFQAEMDRWRTTERLHFAPRELDVYSLIYEYVQICDFLTIMQELDPTDRQIYGGMHEGETPGLWAVIETDNTQEAIRVWSTYAWLTGDLDTYRENIAAAWYYALNNPAWLEEGEPSENYYRVHNCGWGLVAESRYRQVYGDSSYHWYADSCAAFIEGHRLSYTSGSYYSLNPLVEGWAAGTLYDYGIEHSDPAAIAHALIVGSDVQDWIAANPNRLNSNENWAMSGGTALWGVCHSVFADDPSAGQAWLPQYLPYLDTYAGIGQWNNSWNVWYAHAWHACAAVLNDPLCTQHASALVDTLLDADTDNDGGIMATSTDPPTMDQSWISCYLDYMGMETYLLQTPPFDAQAMGFLEPNGALPVALGDSVAVRVIVASAGTQAFGNVTASVSGGFSAAAATFLDFADIDTVDLGVWTPTQTGNIQLAMSLTPGGAVTNNDTASMWVQVLGWGQVEGEVRDAESGQPLAADLSFYREGFPANVPLYTGSTDPLTGLYQVAVIEGIYRVVVDPQIPYTDREASDVEIQMGGTATVNFRLFPAPVLLVDDDLGDTLEYYYILSLDSAQYDAYVWDIAQNGAPEDVLSLFQAVIWFTGNDSTTTLEATERAVLTAYLDNGGDLLLTGQNIAQDLAAEPFLANYLKAQFISGSTGALWVNGVSGDPLMGGMECWFLGAGGANNQNSTDAIEPLPPAFTSMIYPDNSVAALRCEALLAGYKLMFLAFGLEGVTGISETTSRAVLLDSVLQWFGVPPGINAVSLAAAAPQQFDLLDLYPNPFNSEVRIQFSLAQLSPVDLQIFNLRGEEVVTLHLGYLDPGQHAVNYRFPESVSSGLYFVRVMYPAVAQSVGQASPPVWRTAKAILLK